MALRWLQRQVWLTLGHTTGAGKGPARQNTINKGQCATQDNYWKSFTKPS